MKNRGLIRSCFSHPGRWLFLLVWATAFLLGTPQSCVQQTYAQQGNSESPAATKEPLGPQAIPASQISIKAEETNTTVRSLRDRPAPQPSIEEIAGEIAGALELYEEMLERTEKSLTGSLSFREFEDLERRWRRADVLVAEWQSQVRRRAHSIDRDLETLQHMRRAWELTLESAETTGLQEVHVEVSRSAIGSVNELENQFGERRAELLTLQGQITRASEIIEEAIRQISESKSEFQSQISKFEAPPVWRVVTNPPPRAAHIEALRQGWTKSRMDFVEFVHQYGKDLIVFGLIYLGLLALFFYLKRRTGQLDDYRQKFEASLLALARPISSSLVIGLTLMLVFFPDAPRIVDDIVVLVLFVPLYRIIPPTMARRIKGALIALIVVCVLGRIADALPYLSLLQRAVLLIISVIALVVAFRSPRKIGIDQIDKLSSWDRPIQVTRWLAKMLLAVAIIANLIGDVSLAALLTNVVVMSAYLGVLLYSIYLILEGSIWVGLSTEFARRFRMVQRHEELVRRRLLTVIRVGLVLLWAAETVKFIHIFDLVWTVVITALTTPARFGEVGISIGNILAFAVTIWASYGVSKFLRFVLDEDVFPRLTIPRGVPQAISTGIHYVILLFGFFLAVAATGIELSKFTILAGALGVGIGFGLQNIVNNFVSGLILLVERPIMPGDTVQIGDLAGEVKRIGMRSSTVRTWRGAEVIVPNGNLISNEVINWTLSDKQRRIDINVGVAYGTDPETVVELLVNVGGNHPDVLEHPAPYALFLGFGDSSLDFELRVWTVNFSRFLRIKSEVSIAVEKALKQAEITIPFPQRDVHIKPSDDTTKPVVRPKKKAAAPPDDKTQSGTGEEDSSAEASNLDS